MVYNGKTKRSSWQIKITSRFFGKQDRDYSPFGEACGPEKTAEVESKALTANQHDKICIYIIINAAIQHPHTDHLQITTAYISYYMQNISDNLILISDRKSVGK